MEDRGNENNNFDVEHGQGEGISGGHNHRRVPVPDETVDLNASISAGGSDDGGVSIEYGNDNDEQDHERSIASMMSADSLQSSGTTSMASSTASSCDFDDDSDNDDDVDNNNNNDDDDENGRILKERGLSRQLSIVLSNDELELINEAATGGGSQQQNRPSTPPPNQQSQQHQLETSGGSPSTPTKLRKSGKNNKGSNKNSQNSQYYTQHNHSDLATGSKVVTKKVRATVRRNTLKVPMKKQNRVIKSTTTPLVDTVRSSVHVAKKSKEKIAEKTKEFAANHKINAVQPIRNLLSPNKNSGGDRSVRSSNRNNDESSIINSSRQNSGDRSVRSSRNDGESSMINSSRHSLGGSQHSLGSAHHSSSHHIITVEEENENDDNNEWGIQQQQQWQQDQRLKQQQHEQQQQPPNEQQPVRMSGLRRLSLKAAGHRSSMRHLIHRSKSTESQGSDNQQQHQKQQQRPTRVRGRLSIEPSQHQLAIPNLDSLDLSSVGSGGSESNRGDLDRSSSHHNNNYRQGVDLIDHLNNNDSNNSSGRGSSNNNNSYRGSQLRQDRLPSFANKKVTVDPKLPPKQYTLRISAKNNFTGRPTNMFDKILELVGLSNAESDWEVGTNLSRGRCCCNPSQLITRYLHWCFRVTFITYLFSATVLFFGLTVIFALLMMFSGHYHPQCIHVNGQDFGSTGTDEFSDAYALSWTTFSTVGYGLIYPATSAVVDNMRQECVGITILTTLEAFVGILFASMTGAIMFAKITRIRSHAMVSFSDPIVVRYGSGIVQQQNDKSDADSDDDSSNDGSSAYDKSRIPCPKLEFRVVNRLNNVIRGEIMDCQMAIVAVIDADNADDTLIKTLTKVNQRRRKGKKRGSHHVKKQPRRISKSSRSDSNVSDKSNGSGSGNNGIGNSSRSRRHLTKIKSYRFSIIPTDAEEPKEPQSPPSMPPPPPLVAGSPLVGSPTSRPVSPPIPIPENESIQLSATKGLYKRTSTRSSIRSSIADSSSEFSTTEFTPTIMSPPTPTSPSFRRRNAELMRKSKMQQIKQFTAFEEDHAGRFASKRMFTKLEIDSPDHPFFKRVWLARHTLNESSPLITKEARQKIRANNGFWPSDMNDHKSVREAICFDHIIVSFSGTSNNDASSVYAQKIYDFEDVNVGYRFVTMLYRDAKHGHLGVDMTLLNDVVEQVGGGGEPFDEQERIEEMLNRTQRPQDISML